MSLNGILKKKIYILFRLNKEYQEKKNEKSPIKYYKSTLNNEYCSDGNSNKHKHNSSSGSS